jgi:mono/diheme cytochrome c family protein
MIAAAAAVAARAITAFTWRAVRRAEAVIGRVLHRQITKALPGAPVLSGECRPSGGEWRSPRNSVAGHGTAGLESRPVKNLKKNLLIAVSVLIAAVALGLPALVGVRPFIGAKKRPLTARTFERTPARLERGRYLLTSGHPPCGLCHSPMDTTGGGMKVKEGMWLAGRSWAPEGVPFVTAPNLTPDPETGIGAWTDDQLARAIREGIGHDGRTLFPIMPYEKFRNMTDEDLASIIVYLRSLPPVVNTLAPSQVPFPVKYLINSVPQPVEAPVTADLSTAESRGRYNVEVLAVCGDCHTPRDAQGTRVPNMAFAGGTPLPFDGRRTVASANITPAVNGIPYYTEELFLEAIRTGKVRARPLDEMMPTHYFRNMTDQDLKDIFAYLKTLTPVDHYVDNALPPTLCPKCGLVHGGGERNRK